MNEPEPKRSSGAALKAWIRSLFLPVERSRLQADMAVLELDLRRRVKNWGRCSELEEPWAREACGLLTLAREASDRFDTEGAWARLDAARRAAVDGLESVELRNLARSLREEAAGKKSLRGSWRVKAIQNVLAGFDDSKEPGASDRVTLRCALFIRDEGLRNQYRKVVLLRRQLAVLLVFLVVAVGVLLGLQRWWPIDVSVDANPGDERIWAHVAAWGILGGSVAAVVSVIRNSLQAQVPEQIRAGVITSIRPLLGAAAALASYVLVRAEAFGIAVTANAGVFAVAFAAGFSESLIVRAVGAVGARGTAGEG
jgi:hypothetical protein